MSEYLKRKDVDVNYHHHHNLEVVRQIFNLMLF